VDCEFEGDCDGVELELQVLVPVELECFGHIGHRKHFVFVMVDHIQELKVQAVSPVQEVPNFGFIY